MRRESSSKHTRCSMDTDWPVKRKFLAVYDYGMGGTWSTIFARSATEIKDKFPQLTVYDYERLPAWITPAWLTILESKRIYDIDEPPAGYFKLLLEEKEFGPRGKEQ